MKIILLVITFFSFSLSSMQRPIQRKRRSEISDLVGEEYKCKWCEHSCIYRKSITEHERRCSRKEISQKLTPQELSVLFVCEFQDCRFCGTFKEVQQHEYTHDHDTPIKQHNNLPALITLEKPSLPINDNPALENFKCAIEKLLNIKKIEEVHTAPALKNQQKLTKHFMQCKICDFPFIKKAKYINHMLKHNYLFPPHKRDEAYRQRIKRYQNTPTDEIIIID